MKALRLLRAILLIGILVANHIIGPVALITGPGVQAIGLLGALFSRAGVRNSAALAQVLPADTSRIFIGNIGAKSSMQFILPSTSDVSTPSLITGRISLSVSSSRVKLARLDITGNTVFVNGHSTGPLSLSLGGNMQPQGLSINPGPNSYQIDVKFIANLQLGRDRRVFSVPLELHASLDSSGETNSGSIRGIIPLNVPLIGGATLIGSIFLEPIPASQVISNQGLTSYGTYSQATSRGHAALVNLMSGNLIIDPVDLSFGGPGPAIGIERTYNVQKAFSGRFGGGWTSILDAFLVPCDRGVTCPADNAGNSIAKYWYHDPSGANYFFGNSFSLDEPLRVPGLRATLMRDRQTIIYDNGVKFNFATGLVGIEDRNGNQIKIEIGKITDSSGRSITINYDNGLVSSLIPNVPGISRVFYEYEEGYLLRKVIKKDSEDRIIETTEYRYDRTKCGRPLDTIINPRGFITKFTYRPGDDPPDCWSGTRLNWHVETMQFARESGNQPSSFDVYEYEYDARGKLDPLVENTVKDPEGNITTYLFARNEVFFSPGPAYIIDAIGRETSFEYDAYSYDPTHISNSSRDRFWVYDWQGRLLSVEESPFKTTFEYCLTPTLPPAFGCPLDFELGSTSTKSFLNSFLVKRVTDPEGNSTEFTYDDRGNKRTVMNALGKVTEFSYRFDNTSHPQGLLERIKRPRGETRVAYHYDPISGLLDNITVEDPLKRVSKALFDGAGRTKEQISAEGKRTRYELDFLSRLREVTYQDGTKVTLVYDTLGGTLTSMTDGTGTTTFPEYDHRNRLKKKILPDGQVISYNYDKVGNLLSKTDTSGTVAYFYDEVNRLNRLIDLDGGLVEFGPFHANDRPLKVTYPNGMRINREWDGAGRLTRIHATTLSDTKTLVDLSYEYAFVPPEKENPIESSLLRKVTYKDDDTATDDYTIEYGYDKLKQLTSEITFFASGPTGRRSWTYDDNNNRKSQTLGTGERAIVRDYEYDDADQLKMVCKPGELTGCDPDPFTLTSYTYDKNGNLTDRSDGLKLEYNAANHTASITPPAADGGTAAKLTMVYSGLDQIQRVSVQRGAEPATKFTYNRTGIGPSSEQPGDTGGSPSYYTRTPGGGLVSLRRGGRTFYYITDRLGSVIALTASSSEGSGEAIIVNRYRYDPWGNILSESENPNAHQPFRFISAEYDVSTGLYKLGARYYDPKIGRFTQSDSIGGGYTYALNDPINKIDPSGYLPEWLTDVVSNMANFIEVGAALGPLIVLAFFVFGNAAIQGGIALTVAVLGFGTALGVSIAAGALLGLAVYVVLEVGYTIVTKTVDILETEESEEFNKDRYDYKNDPDIIMIRKQLDEDWAQFRRGRKSSTPK